MTRIAIIGAGMAGLTLANELNAYADVQVYEKSKGFGGRMATRTKNGFHFDHGAQFFISKSNDFKQFLQPYIRQGVVARWDAKFVELTRNKVTYEWQWSHEVPHYVAAPDMSALALAMAENISVKLNARVNKIIKSEQQWQLTDESGNILGCYDWVILAMPAEQVVTLLPEACQFKSEARVKNMKACYSLMLGFEKQLKLDWDAALVKDADISWVCNNQSKPGRAPQSSLLIHSTNKWADENINMHDDDVADYLIKETSDVIEQNVAIAVHVDLHRWRYANIGKQYGEKSLLDTDNNLAAIGDWCIKGRIESAFLSARDASTKLKTYL